MEKEVKNNENVNNSENNNKPAEKMSLMKKICIALGIIGAVLSFIFGFFTGRKFGGGRDDNRRESERSSENVGNVNNGGNRYQPQQGGNRPTMRPTSTSQFNQAPNRSAEQLS